MDGLLVFNKPQGITSNNTLQKIRKIFKNKKSGYIGSLDPIASGILLICFGRSTKLFNLIIKEKKTYTVTAILGKTTNTYDAYGYITKINKNFIIKQKNIEKILYKFKGKITQTTPVYSAVKFKGIPLYKYAIKGIKIKKKRIITIYDIKLIKYKRNLIKLKIKCSKGTYIRSIIHEIGKKLKCGAFITKLKRIKIGKYYIKNAFNFYDLQKKKNILITHKKLTNYYKNEKNNINKTWRKCLE